tara:strand:- start:243 stop:449 length:207 start_codon:yes stop_codon:yes gene_type:complete
MDIQIGDLVKLSGLAEHSYGVQFGTVIGDEGRGDLNEVKVMMYTAGLGQFTRWIHLSRLERVTPVGRL